MAYATTIDTQTDLFKLICLIVVAIAFEYKQINLDFTHLSSFY